MEIKAAQPVGRATFTKIILKVSSRCLRRHDHEALLAWTSNPVPRITHGILRMVPAQRGF